MSVEREPAFRIAGETGRLAVERVRTRLEERRARGLLEPEEVERVANWKLRVLGEGAASEAFRRCCMTWEIDPAPPITSHRAVVGVVLVAAKRLARRLLRFQTEAQFVRQRDFNWNLLLVLREILERTDRGR